MNLKIDEFDARIIIYANEYTLEKIIYELGRNYKKNEIEYYIERSLSKREIEVMKLVISGCSNSEISQRLGITKNTVKAHISNVIKKLAVKDRVQAAVKVTKENLLQ